MSDAIPIERAAQQSIVLAMRGGATFADAHKEGGWQIHYADGRFECVEYGDNPSRRVFASEEEFLRFLRRFHDAELACSPGGAPLSEADAWQRILRRLQPAGAYAHGHGHGRGANRRRFRGATLGAVAFTLALAAVLAHQKWHPRAEALRAGLPGAATHAAPAAMTKGLEAKDWQRVQDEHRRSVEAAKAAARPTQP